MAGAAEVGRVGRRIFHKIWDREPVNDRAANDPVWCLGCSYSLDTKTYGTTPHLTESTPPADGNAIIPLDDSNTLTFSAADINTSTPQTTAASANKQPTPSSSTTNAALAPAATTSASAKTQADTPPESVASSFDSSLAYEDPGQDGGWPPAFLDDFESRIWMTYRTGFEVIQRSTDPKATSSLSFAMRLKTSFGDQTNGFSSDTGWGCMIRSGQSLLANAILIARLGRGTYLPATAALPVPRRNWLLTAPVCIFRMETWN